MCCQPTGVLHHWPSRNFESFKHLPLCLAPHQLQSHPSFLVPFFWHAYFRPPPKHQRIQQIQCSHAILLPSQNRKNVWRVVKIQRQGALWPSLDNLNLKTFCLTILSTSQSRGPQPRNNNHWPRKRRSAAWRARADEIWWVWRTFLKCRSSCLCHFRRRWRWERQHQDGIRCLGLECSNPRHLLQVKVHLAMLPPGIGGLERQKPSHFGSVLSVTCPSWKTSRCSSSAQTWSGLVASAAAWRAGNCKTLSVIFLEANAFWGLINRKKRGKVMQRCCTQTAQQKHSCSADSALAAALVRKTTDLRKFRLLMIPWFHFLYNFPCRVLFVCFWASGLPFLYSFICQAHFQIGVGPKLAVRKRHRPCWKCFGGKKSCKSNPQNRPRNSGFRSFSYWSEHFGWIGWKGCVSPSVTTAWRAPWKIDRMWFETRSSHVTIKVHSSPLTLPSNGLETLLSQLLLQLAVALEYHPLHLPPWHLHAPWTTHFAFARWLKGLTAEVQRTWERQNFKTSTLQGTTMSQLESWNLRTKKHDRKSLHKHIT